MWPSLHSSRLSILPGRTAQGPFTWHRFTTKDQKVSLFTQHFLGPFFAVFFQITERLRRRREGVLVHRLLFFFPCFVRACLMTLPTSLMSSVALRTAADIPAFSSVRMGEKSEGTGTLSSGSCGPDL